ncbi:MAG TPA: AAA family ATPase [Candidatus Eremiobacteraceae bacterium]|nr:AAA family ATPase [Candidatus Eremiobacteraceae bacterium]
MSAQSPIIIGEGRLLIDRADQITTKKMRWLWPKRIPLGTITTFAGIPGEGKSLVVADIISRVTRQHRFPDAENPLDGPAEVLIISGEDDAETALVPRLEAAGADLSRIHVVRAVVLNEKSSVPIEREVRLDSDVKKITDTLRDNPAIAFVVIDPVTDSLGAVSMYKEQEIRALLRPLRSKGIAVLLVAHLNKKEGLAAIHRVGGAAAFIGLARASWLFATNQETKQRQMIPLKNNYASRSTPGVVFELEEVPVRIEDKDELVPRVKWLGESDVDANDILDAAILRADAKAVAMEFLKQMLADGPKEATTVEEAAKQQGISKRTLRRAKAELRVESSKPFGPKWMWSLP